MVGNGLSGATIGFRVYDRYDELGEVGADFCIVTGYLPRDISGLSAGYYNRSPYMMMLSEGGTTQLLTIVPAPGFNPAEALELKIAVSPAGVASGYVRFGAGGWTHIGDVTVDFWPDAHAAADGCYIDSPTQGNIRYEPFIEGYMENIGLIGPPYIETDSLPDGIVGWEYEEELHAEGVPPCTWAVIAGALPPGLTLTTSGHVSGTPTAVGSYAFTVRVTDGQTPPASAEREYTVNIFEAQSGSIADMKQLADGTVVEIPGVIVTALFNPVLYAEQPDRFSGIRVVWDDESVSEGEQVNVAGTLQTNADGEREILALDIRSTGTASVDPVGLNLKALGGGDFFYNPGPPISGQQGVLGGSGLNNIGLLVKVWGNVTYVDSSTFLVDDGSAGPVPVTVPPGVTVSSDWQVVEVTGVSSCYKDGSDLYRLIRVRRQSDIVVPAGAEPPPSPP